MTCIKNMKKRKRKVKKKYNSLKQEYEKDKLHESNEKSISNEIQKKEQLINFKIFKVNIYPKIKN